MKRRALFGVILILALSMTAASWDVLAHSMIMEQINGGPQNTNSDEIYGITSPDFVNYLLNTPYFSWLYGQTHTNFMRIWNQTQAPADKPLGMGFVAHNGVWGADYTAHVSSLTLGDPAHGYIIAKATALEIAFGGLGIWALLDLEGEGKLPLRLELCHNIIEYVIDIQVWMSDPSIASRVVAAAAGRNAAMQQLVKTAYAGLLVAYSQKTEARLNHPAAQYILQTSESAFQQRVVLYAGLFATASDPNDLLFNKLDPYLRALASQMFGLELLPGQAGQLLGLVLQMGLTNDVVSELGATVNYVRDQLIAHQIVYAP